MSQSTLDDDDELMGEAASEIREDVETHLDAARTELPAAADVWETDAENTLGVLNGLKSALEIGEAEEHLRDARKWFMVGERADAFEDPESLQAEIDAIEALIEEIGDAREGVNDLVNTVPALRSDLAELNAAGGEPGEDEPDEESTETEE